MVLSVRLVNEEHASDVTRIGKESFRAAFEAFTPPEELEKYLETAYTPEAQKRELNDPSRYTIMAFMNKNIPIGFCQFKENKKAYDVIGDPEAMEIYRLFIDQNYVGRGAGKALMEHVIIKSQELGKKTVWLEVLESNKPALSLYTKLGFKKVGSHFFPLAEKEVVYIMTKELNV